MWENPTMALNIKDEETEALVAKLTSLTGETETEAVRTAARERLERLEPQPKRKRKKMTAEEMRNWLETEIWPLIPDEVLGKAISKAEREEILGYGPDGGVILDSSAVVAVVQEEPGREEIEAKMRAGGRASRSAPRLWSRRRWSMVRTSGESRAKRPFHALRKEFGVDSDPIRRGARSVAATGLRPASERVAIPPR